MNWAKALVSITVGYLAIWMGDGGWAFIAFTSGLWAGIYVSRAIEADNERRRRAREARMAP